MADRFKIVETDNFDGDYPNEKELGLPPLTKYEAKRIVTTINACLSGNHKSRWWKVEPLNYVLQPGFEP